MSDISAPQPSVDTVFDKDVTRFNALIQEIEHFRDEVDTNVARGMTIRTIASCLIEFARKQFCFFKVGFDPDKHSLILGERDKEPKYTKEYVIGRLLEQIGVDLTILQQAYCSRFSSSLRKREALEMADKLGQAALQLAIDGKIIRKETAVLSYFHKMPLVRVIPYANVAIIGVPITCVNMENNFRDFLAIPHEIGHYVYWHARSSVGAEVRPSNDSRLSRTIYETVTNLDRINWQSIIPLFPKSFDPFKQVYERLNEVPTAILPEEIFVRLEEWVQEGGLEVWPEEILTALTVLSKKETQENWLQGEGLQHAGVNILETSFEEWSLSGGVLPEDMARIIQELSESGLFEEILGTLTVSLEYQLLDEGLLEKVKNTIIKQLGEFSEDMPQIKQHLEVLFRQFKDKGTRLYDLGQLVKVTSASLVDLLSYEACKRQSVAKALMIAWQEEIFADIYGCLVAGPVVALTFYELLFDNHTLSEGDGKHPIPYVRPDIYINTLNSMFPIDNASEKEAFKNKSGEEMSELVYMLDYEKESLLNERLKGQKLELPLLRLDGKSSQIDWGRLKCLLKTVTDELLKDIEALFKANGTELKPDSWTKTIQNSDVATLFDEFETYFMSLKNNESIEVYELKGDMLSPNFYFDYLYEQWDDDALERKKIPYEHTTDSAEVCWGELLPADKDKKEDEKNRCPGWEFLISESGWTVGGPECDGNEYP